MFKLKFVHRPIFALRTVFRPLHLGEANILPTSVDKNSDEFKVIFVDMA